MRNSELSNLQFDNVIDQGNQIAISFYGLKNVGNKELITRFVTDENMVNYVREYIDRFSDYDSNVIFK